MVCFSILIDDFCSSCDIFPTSLVVGSVPRRANSSLVESGGGGLPAVQSISYTLSRQDYGRHCHVRNRRKRSLFFKSTRFVKPIQIKCIFDVKGASVSILIHLAEFALVLDAARGGPLLRPQQRKPGAEATALKRSRRRRRRGRILCKTRRDEGRKQQPPSPPALTPITRKSPFALPTPI